MTYEEAQILRYFIGHFVKYVFDILIWMDYVLNT